jgi:hypothetical protein
MPSDIYGSTGSYRCNAEDCQGAVDEMDYINSISPPGSSFKIELPFNGMSAIFPIAAFARVACHAYVSGGTALHVLYKGE